MVEYNVALEGKTVLEVLFDLAEKWQKESTAKQLCMMVAIKWIMGE